MMKGREGEMESFIKVEICNYSLKHDVFFQ